ncbi:MAG: hypothetical protein AAB737_00840 [Patescibacteria group bacterium]
MKQSPEHRPGVSTGEALARESKEGVSVLPVGDFLVQVYLARLAFPEEAKPMNAWMRGEEVRDSLSRRYRAFIEDPEREPSGTEVDTHDDGAMQALLAGIQKHAPEQTVH